VARRKLAGHRVYKSSPYKITHRALQRIPATGKFNHRDTGSPPRGSAVTSCRSSLSLFSPVPCGPGLPRRPLVRFRNIDPVDEKRNSVRYLSAYRVQLLSRACARALLHPAGRIIENVKRDVDLAGRRGRGEGDNKWRFAVFLVNVGEYRREGGNFGGTLERLRRRS
jgi:hypothetical protein